METFENENLTGDFENGVWKNSCANSKNKYLDKIDNFFNVIESC